MRRGILFFSFLVAGAFLFFAQASCAHASLTVADGTHYSSATPVVWHLSDSPVLVQGSLSVYSGIELVVEPGVIIKLAYQKGKINIFGKLTAVGTKDTSIVFTSDRDTAAPGDWQDINVSGAGASAKIEYVTVMYAGGGNADDAIVINSTNNVSITHSEIKNNRYCAFKIINSEPTIVENIISNNSYGVCSTSTNKTPVVKNNSFFNNRIYGVTAQNIWNGMLTGHIDARENWWGSSSGPRFSPTKDGDRDRITANVTYDPWLTADPNSSPPEPPPGPDPAIIIPGIMGSWEKDGVWQIDPIFHTYYNLYDEFVAEGYASEQDLFTFPYEWRNSNIENAKILHTRIQQIKADTGRSKVDIVAHSMGGLLAREYIESDYYDDDVDHLITLGTPHFGAPKDYIKWEAGAFFSDIFELAGKKFFEHEAKENGYDSIFHYIRDRMESVRELLPVYDYLWDDNGTGYDLRTGYPNNYPRNEFLENLNDIENVKALEGVDFTNIVGKQIGQTTTTTGFNVINANMGEIWEHGYPHGFEIPILTDQGLKKGEGDRTVPLYSAEGGFVPFTGTKYFESNHNEIPTDAQKDVLETLTGTRPELDVKNWVIDDILLGLVFSPVDIQIISPSGKRLGKDFESGGEFNEIEGAFYTGYNTNTEFLTIPNPEEGEYKIVTQGVDEGGDFKVELAKISENPENFDNANASTATISGTSQSDEIGEAAFEIDEEEIVFDIPSLLAAIRRNIENYFHDGETLLNEEEFGYYIDRLNRVETLCGDLLEERENNKPIEKIQKEIHSHIDHLTRHIENNISVTIDENTANIVTNYLLKIKSYNY